MAVAVVLKLRFQSQVSQTYRWFHCRYFHLLYTVLCKIMSHPSIIYILLRKWERFIETRKHAPKIQVIKVQNRKSLKWKSKFDITSFNTVSLVFFSAVFRNNSLLWMSAAFCSIFVKMIWLCSEEADPWLIPIFFLVQVSYFLNLFILRHCT